MLDRRLNFCLVAFFLSVFCVTPVHADSCNSVIEGASTAGYQGKYGSYDSLGLCHSRSTADEAECRRLTGSLFKAFFPDGGAGYTHCVFSVPSSGSGSSSYSGGTCPAGKTICGNGCMPIGAVCCASQGGFCKAGEVCGPDSCTRPANPQEIEQQQAEVNCNRHVDQLNQNLQRFYKDKSTGFTIEMILEIEVSAIDKYCRLAGHPNLSVWAHSKFNEVESALQSAERQKDDVRYQKCRNELKSIVNDWNNTQDYQRRREIADRLRRTAGLAIPQLASDDLCSDWRNKDDTGAWIDKTLAAFDAAVRAGPSQPPSPTGLDPARWQRIQQSRGLQHDQCAANASKTGWCNSNTIGEKKICAATPVMMGPNNFELRLTGYCPDSEYFFTVTTYNDDGRCTKSVYFAKPGSRAQVFSSTSGGMPEPKVIDGIDAIAPAGANYTTEQLQACYANRHNGCPCD